MEQYYSSDDDVVWGSLTKREIKRGRRNKKTGTESGSTTYQQMIQLKRNKDNFLTI